MGIGGGDGAAPGTLVLYRLDKLERWSPKDGRTVRFGRDQRDVEVCVGGDDPGVSRLHGVLTCSGGTWLLRNEGQRDIQIGDSRYLKHGYEVPLAEGYTSLLVHGEEPRVHLVEAFVAGPDGWRRRPRQGARTTPVRVWDLDEKERLAIVAIAEEYLRDDDSSRPASWRQAAELLTQLDPGGRWTHKSVERVVREVRLRLTAAGVGGLLEGEGKNAGDTLKCNLIRVLMRSNTIGRKDLSLIDLDDDASSTRTG